MQLRGPCTEREAGAWACSAASAREIEERRLRLDQLNSISWRGGNGEERRGRDRSWCALPARRARGNAATRLGSRRTDSTDAADEPIGGRPPRRRMISSTSKPASACAASFSTQLVRAPGSPLCGAAVVLRRSPGIHFLVGAVVTSPRIATDLSPPVAGRGLAVDQRDDFEQRSQCGPGQGRGATRPPGRRSAWRSAGRARCRRPPLLVLERRRVQITHAQESWEETCPPGARSRPVVQMRVEASIFSSPSPRQDRQRAVLPDFTVSPLETTAHEVTDVGPPSAASGSCSSSRSILGVRSISGVRSTRSTPRILAATFSVSGDSVASHASNSG